MAAIESLPLSILYYLVLKSQQRSDFSYFFRISYFLVILIFLSYCDTVKIDIFAWYIFLCNALDVQKIDGSDQNYS